MSFLARQIEREGASVQGALTHSNTGWHPTKKTKTSELPNHTSHDDPVKQYDRSILKFRNLLDGLEKCCSGICEFSNVNKFWEKYFGVLNLSSRELNYNDVSLLGKGLKFCPTPTMVDHGRLKESIDKFIRNCSLKLFFSNVESSDQQEEHLKAFSHNEFKLPSKFNPHMPSNLEHVYYLILEEVLNYTPVKGKFRKSNLTEQQKISLNNLVDDTDIVIKKADKGSNIVLQNKSDYIKECMQQLGNKKFYMKLDCDMTAKFKSKVEGVVSEMFESKQIDQKAFNYLMSGGHRTPIFYTLPKIHKPYEFIPPGRPIVSSIDSPTEKISQLLDSVGVPKATQCL